LGRPQRALRLLLVQALLNVLRIDERDDAVDARKFPNDGIHEEGLHDGRRVRHPRRLDDDPVQDELSRVNPTGELVQHLDQIRAHGAAHAAVEYLEDLLAGLEFGVFRQELVVDRHRAKLVFNDGNLLPVRCGENVIEERGFAASEEAGEHRHRYSVARHLLLIARCHGRRARDSPTPVVKKKHVAVPEVAKKLPEVPKRALFRGTCLHETAPVGVLRVPFPPCMVGKERNLISKNT
jgi:hypothetical protein